MSAEYTQNPDLNNSPPMGEEELYNVFNDLAYEQILQHEGDASSPFHSAKKSPWKFPTNCFDNFQPFHNYATIPESNELDNSFNDQIDLLESFRKQLDDFSAETNLSDTGSDDTFANFPSPFASTSSIGDLEEYLSFSSLTLSDHYESEKLSSSDSHSPDSSSFELLNASSLSEDIALDVNTPENTERSNLESTNSSAIYEPEQEKKVWGEMITFSQVLYPNLELIWKPETAASQTVKPETTASQTVKPETTASQTVKPETTASQTVKPETAASQIVKLETAASLTFKPETVASLTFKPETMASQTLKPETLASLTLKPGTLASLTLKPETVAALTFKPETVASLRVTPATVASQRVNPLCTAVIDRKNLVWYTPSISSPRLLMIPVEEPENL